MASILRAFFVLLSFFLSHHALAYRYNINSHGVSVDWDNPSAVAQEFANAYNRLAKPSCTLNGSTTATWYMRVSSVNTTARTVAITIERSYNNGVSKTCGETTLSDNVPFTLTGKNDCTQSDKLVDPAGCLDPVSCPDGQQRNPETNTCDCTSGFDAGGQMATGDVYTACMGGCKLRLYSGWYDKAANLTWGYDWKQTGDKCTPTDGEVTSPTDPKVEDAKRCPVGQCPGNQNGTSVCVPCENSKQTDKTTSSETTKDTPAGASSPASTSTKTETSDSRTSCTGDQCTTQRDVTTTNPDGSKTTKTETKTEPKSDYCTDNPKADVCKGTESSWGGECEGGFTCDGDAVQCAQAQAAHQMRCKLTETDTDAISKFNALKSDGLSGLNLPNLTINTPTVEAFGSCPIADTSVDLGFGPIAFPLSYLCPYLEVIHRVITSFGALFWLMIVFVKGN